MSKHTPGPWRSGTAYDTRYIKVVCQGPSNVICEVKGGGIPEETAIADARLIAAAPDLLEALKFGRDAFGHDGGCLPELRPLIGDAPCAHCLFDVAIKKAEGRGE